MNFQMFKLDLEKAEEPGIKLPTCRGTRDQITNICWIIKKAREFQENIYFCFIDYAKAFRLGLPWFSGLWTQTGTHSSQFLVLQLADARSGVNSYSEWMDGWMAK